MTKLIANNMNWKWKVSLVLSLFWIGLITMNGENFSLYSDETRTFFVTWLPLTVWVIYRWIVIGNESVET